MDATIKTGQTIRLTNGLDVQVREIHPEAGIFCFSKTPVERCVGGTGDQAGAPLGLGNHFWIPIPDGFEAFKRAGQEYGVYVGIRRKE